MKLLLFSDIHQDLGALKILMSTPADVYIAAGDLANWSRGLEECGRILKPHGEKVWVLPGNHESAQQIAALCETFGLRNFHEQAWRAGNYWIAGLGYSSPTPFDTPGEYTEEELAARLEKFAGLEPLILVCHSPPWGTGLDRVGLNRHAGSRAVLAFVEKHAPEYFFCGHIHECAGVQVRMGRTRAVNLGKKGFLLSVD
ncbi:MAG: metallophosphoesterase [Acidobacteria bacterium]|nr:metallophosphoesterase [Acidobacteriota bacterium]